MHVMLCHKFAEFILIVFQYIHNWICNLLQIVQYSSNFYWWIAKNCRSTVCSWFL